MERLWIGIVLLTIMILLWALAQANERAINVQKNQKREAARGYIFAPEPSDVPSIVLSNYFQ